MGSAVRRFGCKQTGKYISGIKGGHFKREAREVEMGIHFSWVINTERKGVSQYPWGIYFPHAP